MLGAWFKKESPILGMMGMGGGIASRLLGADTAFFVEYIVLAGGGGGGCDAGAGGGAGGYLTNGTSDYELELGIDYTVTIGTGGIGGPTSTSPFRGRNGNDSVFATITAKGGGGGGSGGTAPDGPGNPGGSGGGGRRASGTPGFGYNPSTPGPVLSAVPLPSPYPLTQGYPAGDASSPLSSPGGGGAGGQGGASVSSSRAGHGGTGVTNPLVSPVNSGQIGGGGGGGSDTGSEVGGNGTFGGGGGNNGGAGSAGSGGTGGGGGGGGAGSAGGPGAIGLVAVVYPNEVSFSKTSGNLVNDSPIPAPGSRTSTVFRSGTGTISFS